MTKKHYIIILSTSLVLLAFFTGYFINKQKNQLLLASLRQQLDSTDEQLILANKQLVEQKAEMEELELTKKNLEEEMRSMNPVDELERLSKELAWYKEITKMITEINKVEYEFVSESARNNPDEAVVYIKNLPKDFQGNGIYLLRTAMEIPEEKYKQVSFWNYRDGAAAYAAGKEVNMDMKGRKIGTMEVTQNGPILKQYLNSEDGTSIEFGKFVSP